MGLTRWGRMTVKVLLNFSEVAREAGVDRTTLYNWERSGRFTVEPHDDHKPRRWHIDDIRAWLKPHAGNNDQPSLFEA